MALWTRLLRASAALCSGDATSAVVAAEAAIELAVRTQQGMLELEARSLHCDALLASGRSAEVGAAAIELTRRARIMGSARALLGAVFYEAFAAEQVALSALEHVATQGAVNPHMARRARALLGGVVALDRLDATVVAALRGSLGVIEWVAPASDDVWQAGWGVDHRTRSVWLASGQVASFAQRGTQWKLIEALCDGGGSASKEELVRRVWDEREYHPVRHDNRLHAMVRKVREAIEDDPANPARLLTTDDGYELGQAVRQRR